MLKVKPESSISLSTPEFMEEEDAAEEQQTPTSPFWMQTNNNNLGRLQRLFFNSFVLIIFLLLFALLSLVFIIPSIHLSSNFFRPNFVKRSWDSINLIVVLIALLFGFLSRTINNDDENEKPNCGYDRIDTEVPAGPPIMYDFQQQDTSSSIGLRRQRTSISYPDLRELSPPWNHRGAGDPWRFSDDTHFNYYNVLDSNRNSFRQRNRRENNLHTPGEEELYFPPPQPPSQTPVKLKTKKVHRKFSTDDGERGKMLSPETVSSEKRRARSSEPKRILSAVIDPYPDPTLVQPVSPLTERNKEVDDNVSKEFFSSFYHKKKKKRQRDRSVDNLKTLLHHSQPLPVKKFISVTLPPPPPPPPPPQPPRATITRVAPFVTDKPRTMTTGFNFNGVDDSSSGGESPMKNIPPPPPLPPFKMPDWKFAVEGDFVRLQGMLSDRSVSPDGDEARSPLSDGDTVATLTEMAVFCPSPDVDTKADSFIASFRAGLKLERMSKLGPGSGSGPSNN
ncbi:uncharacterized protein LOC110880239 [Helianthus annuus]|nr:uncharacterized protein LOC110880239 [Helianthus annuus]